MADGNDPKAACIDTVENILSVAQSQRKKPAKIFLLSSIGVDRADQFPFKILNSFGVLDAKKTSEELLLERAAAMGSTGVVIRPGRLVGAPFTNFDLAKLLNKDQGSDKAVLVAKSDILSGDVERADVAEAIVRIIQDKQGKIVPSKVKGLTFSIINGPGSAPTDGEWSSLLRSII